MQPQTIEEKAAAWDEFAAKRKDHVRKLYCCDCGQLRDDFMLVDPVWAQAGFRKDQVACIACVERKLGRELRLGDFRDVPINRQIRRLFTRLPWQCADVLYSKAREFNSRAIELRREGRYELADDRERMADQCWRMGDSILKLYGLPVPTDVPAPGNQLQRTT